jgi:hypothetical protein
MLTMIKKMVELKKKTTIDKTDIEVYNKLEIIDEKSNP